MNLNDLSPLPTASDFLAKSLGAFLLQGYSRGLLKLQRHSLEGMGSFRQPGTR